MNTLDIAILSIGFLFCIVLSECGKVWFKSERHPGLVSCSLYCYHGSFRQALVGWLLAIWALNDRLIWGALKVRSQKSLPDCGTVIASL
jgi:hypothetical protein